VLTNSKAGGFLINENAALRMLKRMKVQFLLHNERDKIDIYITMQRQRNTPFNGWENALNNGVHGG